MGGAHDWLRTTSPKNSFNSTNSAPKEQLQRFSTPELDLPAQAGSEASSTAVTSDQEGTNAGSQATRRSLRSSQRASILKSSQAEFHDASARDTANAFRDAAAMEADDSDSDEDDLLTRRPTRTQSTAQAIQEFESYAEITYTNWKQYATDVVMIPGTYHWLTLDSLLCSADRADGERLRPNKDFICKWRMSNSSGPNPLLQCSRAYLVDDNNTEIPGAELPLNEQTAYPIEMPWKGDDYDRIGTPGGVHFRRADFASEDIKDASALCLEFVNYGSDYQKLELRHSFVEANTTTITQYLQQHRSRCSLHPNLELKLVS